MTKKQRSGGLAVAGCVAFGWGQRRWLEKGVTEGGSRGPAQRGKSHSERHTEGRGRKREGDQAQRWEVQEEEGVRSEYGGLILSADSALGFLGVHEPRGAALGLRIPLLFHKIPLKTTRKRGRQSPGFTTAVDVRWFNSLKIQVLSVTVGLNHRRRGASQSTHVTGVTCRSAQVG